MTHKPKARSPDHAVSDEAAAYIADALMELALQFEATHFAQIRRYYQSITPTAGAGPRQRNPVSQHHDRNGRKRKTSDI
jgi:hypothetical protein